jgi:transcriptional regulator with XRE-family HTH domain
MPRKVDIRLVFQSRLKQIRLASDLSQSELGVKIGLDPSVAATRINRYEKGVHEPDLTTVSLLAGALRVPTAFFFADSDRLSRMILVFDRLAASQKDELLAQLEEG